jgi:hypothetical protein
MHHTLLGSAASVEDGEELFGAQIQQITKPDG